MDTGKSQVTSKHESELQVQRFALPALGRGRRSRPTGKMLRRRKRLGIAPDSPASGARFVGQPADLPEPLPKKDTSTNTPKFYNELCF